VIAPTAPAFNAIRVVTQTMIGFCCIYWFLFPAGASIARITSPGTQEKRDVTDALAQTIKHAPTQKFWRCAAKPEKFLFHKIYLRDIVPGAESS